MGRSCVAASEWRTRFFGNVWMTLLKLGGKLVVDTNTSATK